MNITDLLTQYRTGEQSPKDTVEAVYDRIDTDETNAWITVRDRGDVLTDVAALDAPETQPLYGVPFAIKDNIDYAGLPTSAGCPEYAYVPAETAPVVEQLIDAGGLLIGKTNMDQFASGLVGTRSPYGVCRNVYNPAYISGGSSSGSAVAVAREEVAFALGTDTAGSGRVPAAFNGLVGMKPSRGMVSTRGVVPACASLDCVSIFTQSCRDAMLVESVAAGYDRHDPYSTRRATGTTFDVHPEPVTERTIGIPASEYLEFFGDDRAMTLYEDAIGAIEAVFNDVVVVDFEPFVETADLLYGGPWISERLAALEEFVDDRPDAVHPVVYEILTRGDQYSAIDSFRAFHELERYRQACDRIFEEVDVLVTPTTGTVYTVEEIRDQPIERNSNLGYYTNYVNLLDLAAIAVPTGRFTDGPGFGVTVLGEAGADAVVATVGQQIVSARDDRTHSGTVPTVD